MFSFPLLMIAMMPMIKGINHLFPEFLDPMKYPERYSLTQLFLAIPVLFIGKNFYINGIKSFINRSLNMDTLVMIGTGSAFIYSIFSTILVLTGKHSYVENLYYETSSVIITLIFLGKTLEASSKSKAGESIKKLLNLAPKKAIKIVDGKEIEVDVKDLQINEIVLVKPGEKIATDGTIVEGITSIDESMLTGESIPVEKTVGSKVFAGTINKNGSILFKVEKIGKDTFLSQIVKLVIEAQSSKAPIAKIADRVAGYFVPVVVLIALSSSIIWLVSGRDFVFSLKIFISVLVVACPCALGLATPVAIIVGTGKGAENGILIKNGESLEVAHKIDTIVFDKTGTLTEGNPSVTDIKSFNSYSEIEILQIAFSLEKKSEHPLAEAIIKEAENKGIQSLEVSDFVNIPGTGIKGKINDKMVLIGNKRIYQKIDSDIKNEIESFENQGKTLVFIVIEEKLSGIIACRDNLKSNAGEVIKILKNKGIKPVMLTGDNKNTAYAIGKECGIEKIFYEVLPDEKQNKIKELISNGKNVAMVGDGINDAIALSTAHLGIALGSGTDIAIEGAGIVLIKNNLMDVIKALNLSKKTLRNIKQNLFWAFFYNIILIPVAAGILTLFGGPQLNPILAAFAMSLSSVSVVLNALRLKFVKL